MAMGRQRRQIELVSVGYTVQKLYIVITYSLQSLIQLDSTG
jgi:hypothetical protein